jgi:hypothetical protein
MEIQGFEGPLAGMQGMCFIIAWKLMGCERHIKMDTHYQIDRLINTLP